MGLTKNHLVHPFWLGQSFPKKIIRRQCPNLVLFFREAEAQTTTNIVLVGISFSTPLYLVTLLRCLSSFYNYFTISPFYCRIIFSGTRQNTKISCTPVQTAKYLAEIYNWVSIHIRYDNLRTNSAGLAINRILFRWGGHCCHPET